MGVKQNFLSYILDRTETQDLRCVWDALPAGCSKVIVIDGTNFLLTFMDHHQLRLNSPGVPRLQEFRDALSNFLCAVQAACPGIEFHFLFDGVSSEETLESKEEEANKRFKDRLRQSAEEALKVFEGRGCRGGPRSVHVLKWLLASLLQRLPGQHWIGRAHAEARDLDMACVLHAKLHKAGVLLSDDSDFLVMFSGVVIPFRTFVFQESGLSCKAPSLSNRLRALCLTCLSELQVAAFLAGTDFSPPIVEASWPEITERARRLVASNPVWQDVVQEASVDPAHADAFLANFDTGAYVCVDEGEPSGAAALEAWRCGDSVAYGITATFPRSDMDPILSNLVSSGSQDTDGRMCIIRTRCLAAYSGGALSSSMLNLVRNISFSESVGLADFAKLIPGSCGRPVARAKLQMVGRLAHFLAGPIPDSWDDEEDHVPAFLDIEVEVIREDVLLWCIPHAEWLLQKESRIKDAGRDSNFDVRCPAEDIRSFDHNDLSVVQAKKELQEARECFTNEMDGFGTLTEKGQVQLQSIPDWVWDGARADWKAGEESSCSSALLRSVFYLVTGSDVNTKLAPHLQMELAKVLEGNATVQEQGLLLVLSVVHAIEEGLMLEHVQTLCSSLGVRRLDLNMLRLSGCSDSATQYASALMLGEMCWWMMAMIQDVFCLCGGQRLIFANALPMRGGPVVLGNGIVHKAKDGYKISVKGIEGEPPSEVASHAQMLFEALGAVVTRQLRYGAFKVQGISAHDVFSCHGRIFFYKGVPYTTVVKPFD